MPYGWFKVALAPEVPAGEVVTRHYFGTELVLWRDDQGAVACHEAYCAHLGAHIGFGGRVEGDRIRCPFHGWAYDRAGANCEIPYAARPNAKARLRTFPVAERSGIVFAWYHPLGAEPQWEARDVPEHHDPAFGDYEAYDYTIATCLQEMAENGFDYAHFEFVHSHPQVGTTEHVAFDGISRVMLSSQQFPSSRGPVDARIDVHGWGPGFAITRYKGLIEASLVGLTTPIDEEHTHLTFLFLLRNPDADAHTANIGRAFVKSVTREVQQDIPIWENKRYLPTPALAASEAPIMQLRRWFAQFYVDT
jgi:phenylpropionate dioxygenase-like ring-hydroxylating dioxygenase large terminal subunit